MAKQAQAQTRAVIKQLHGMFAQVGVDSLPVNLARDMAVAHGLSPVTAGIQLYRWREAQGYYKRGSAPMSR